jgi:carboxyl-terminal processing protease
VNDEQVSSSAFYSMVKALGDKWSYYMTPAEYENYKLYTANQYAGIGVTIEKDEATKGFRIVAVTPGSPAEASGVVVGDIMLKVEGEDVAELDTDGVRDLITARLDDSIMVTMQRLDGSVKDMQINCRLINIVPVQSAMLEKKTGYVKISNFEKGSAVASREAVEKLLAEGAVCFVFDVRGNPGGLLSELTDLLDYILPEGDIFVSVDKENREQVTKSDNICIDVPMVVLIDENSYSAAEFFAAALSEYGWAKTVGTKTTGKGRSQITVELSDGSAVHLSSRKYLTPKRVDLSIQGGLSPDVPVERGLDPDIDEQLDRAIYEAQLQLALR